MLVPEWQRKVVACYAHIRYSLLLLTVLTWSLSCRSLQEGTALAGGQWEL